VKNGSTARCQTPASLACASNMSCPSHSPTPSATSPKEFHFAGQTECHSDRLDRVAEAVRLAVWALVKAGEARSPPTSRREPVRNPWQHPSTSVLLFRARGEMPG